MGNPVHGGNLDELARRYGLEKEHILDFSASINPLGPPDWLRSRVNRVLEEVVRYPDPSCRRLRESAAAYGSVQPEAVLPGNGSEELLFAFCHSAAGRGITRTVIPVPSYGDYETASRQAGLEPVLLPTDEAEEFSFASCLEALSEELTAAPAAVCIGRPNNPTGLLPEIGDIKALAAAHPDSLICVDEAFLDFCPEEESLIASTYANILVLRSSTKFFALPGLRLGFAYGSPELLEELSAHIPQWSVNLIAQRTGERLYHDAAYMERTRVCCRQMRTSLTKQIRDVLPGCTVIPGQANFLLVKLPDPGPDAGAFTRRLGVRGIAVRDCSSFHGFPRPCRYVRIAVRTDRENRRLAEALAAEFGGKTPRGQHRHRAAALMIQGTTSDAGKSLLTAAFCRIFQRRGIRVAPFKAQNMSGNAAVTPAGEQIGTAQLVQAEACRIAPDGRMNPVLLKCESDRTARVILKGREAGILDASESPKQYLDAVRSCYDELAAEYELMMIEGAGSPAEVNLRDRDIANMAMAAYAGSPVLLTADIDRGGAVAALTGTMDLLRPWERELISGFILNKFRGDPSLLEPAYDFLFEHTGIPVLGVIPYIPDAGIPEEDGLGFGDGDDADPDKIHILLIALPGMVSFTDVQPLAWNPSVQIQTARSAADVRRSRRPDAVVIPGSRDPASDMRYLEESGMAEEIRRQARRGCRILAFGSSAAMLGDSCNDVDGLSLISQQAVCSTQEARRVTGMHIPSQLEAAGSQLEIRCSTVPGGRAAALITASSGELLGWSSEAGDVWAVAFHGLFDSPQIRRWFISDLAASRGIAVSRDSCTLDDALDRLADTVEAHTDMDAVMKLAGLQ